MDEQNPSLKNLIPPPTLREAHKTARAKFLTSLWIKNRQPSARERAAIAKRFASNEPTRTDVTSPNTTDKTAVRKAALWLAAAILFSATVSTIDVYTAAWMRQLNETSTSWLQANGFATIYFIIKAAFLTSWAWIALSILLLHTEIIHARARAGRL